MESTRHIRCFCYDLSFALTTRDRFIFPKFIILPGQYYDQETNLHNNYFRDYDPSTGRYIESDPIGLRGGINTFGYVKQNPINYYDPLGLRIIGVWARSPELTYGDVILVGFNFDYDWRALPPAITLLESLWRLEGKIDGDIECTDIDDCGNIKREWQVTPWIQFQKTVPIDIWLNALPPQYSIPIALAETAYRAYDHYNVLVVKAIAELFSKTPLAYCLATQ